MTIHRVRSFYIGLYCLALLLIFILSYFWEVNIAGEVGAVIVAAAIIRSSRTLKELESNREILKQLSENSVKEALLWDLYAAIIGTLVNGFSGAIYFVIRNILVF